MQTGKKLIPPLSEETLQKFNLGTDLKSYNQITDFINTEMAERKSLLRLFWYPDISKVSDSLKIHPKIIIDTLMFISSYFPMVVSVETFFQKDDENLFEKLQDEDFTFLEEENIFYNPHNPDIFYKDAKKFIRHAFCIGRTS